MIEALSPLGELLREAGIAVLGFGLLGALIAMVGTFSYRRVTHRPLPVLTTVLVAGGVLMSWLTVQAAAGASVVGTISLTHHASAMTILSIVSVGSILVYGGRQLGDYLACEVSGIVRLPATDTVTDHLRAAQLVAVVTLPEQIDDVPGYPPVEDERKTELAGQTVRIPRWSVREELTDRLARRLERDYVVGHVSVELAADGTIASLALGGRHTGLGSTLPPDTVAVAIRSDPPSDARSGDPVELWTDTDSSRLVAVGTLASATGDVATVILGEDDATVVSAGERYRLLTRPTTPDDSAEFIGALRAADETVTTVAVDAQSQLAGEFVGWLPATVLVIERGDELHPMPADRVPIQAGDRLWVLGTPRALELEVGSISGPKPREDAEITST